MFSFRAAAAAARRWHRRARSSSLDFRTGPARTGPSSFSETVTIVAVKFGIAIFPTDYAISMTELAPAVEQAGFESLWGAEHSHIPVSRLTPYPAGGGLPRMSMHRMDPFTALTGA